MKKEKELEELLKNHIPITASCLNKIIPEDTLYHHHAKKGIYTPSEPFFVVSKTKRIIINRSHGGLFLNHEGLMKYHQLLGVELYPYEKKENWGAGPNKENLLVYTKLEEGKSVPEFNNIQYFKVDPLMQEFSFNMSNGSLSELHKKYESLDDFNIERDDEKFIQFVEEYKDECLMSFSRPLVIELPVDVHYIISEMDGFEKLYWSESKINTQPVDNF